MGKTLQLSFRSFHSAWDRVRRTACSQLACQLWPQLCSDRYVTLGTLLTLPEHQSLCITEGLILALRGCWMRWSTASGTVWMPSDIGGWGGGEKGTVQSWGLLNSCV